MRRVLAGGRRDRVQVRPLTFGVHDLYCHLVNGAAIDGRGGGVQRPVLRHVAVWPHIHRGVLLVRVPVRLWHPAAHELVLALASRP